MSGRLVVIGGDAAGMSGAAAARRADPLVPIVVIERGQHVSYSACGLPYWISGEVGDAARLVSHDATYFRERRDIEVRTGVAAKAIDPERQTVTTDDGDDLDYTALLVATGARPSLPPVPGVDLPGVMTLRDIDSAKAVRARIAGRPSPSALVVGTGPIGMEMAEALCAAGAHAHAIEVRERPIPALPSSVTGPVLDALDAGCTSVRAPARLERIEVSGHLLAVTIDGAVEHHDLVLLGTGIRPNAEIAGAAGCALGAGGAVRVDRRARTSVPGIWAAGDCATAWHLLLGEDVWMPLATTANVQGRIAGNDIGGRGGRFPGTLGSWVSTSFGVSFGATGIDVDPAVAAGHAPRALCRSGRDRSGYMPGVRDLVLRLVWDEPTGRLLGAQMAGAGEVAARLHTLSVAIAAGMTARQLAEVDFGYAPPVSPLRDIVEAVAAAVVGDAP